MTPGIATPTPTRSRHIDYPVPTTAVGTLVAIAASIAPTMMARVIVAPPVAVPPPVGTAAAAACRSESSRCCPSCSCHVFSPSSPWIARHGCRGGSQCDHQSRIATTPTIDADAAGTLAAAGGPQSRLLPLGPKDCDLFGRHPPPPVGLPRPTPTAWIPAQTLHFQNRCHYVPPVLSRSSDQH